MILVTVRQKHSNQQCIRILTAITIGVGYDNITQDFVTMSFIL